MRRVLALPAALLTAVALAACSAGALDQDPPAASGPSASPSAEPSATPEPTPEGERFDDVDLAAALVPLPAYGDEGWGTGTGRPIIADSSAFAAAPECAAAIDAVIALEPEEVVFAGDVYDGVPYARISVARMASPEEAQSSTAALEDAATACADVTGTSAEQSGLVVLASGADASTLLADAGITQLSLGYADSFHLYLTAFTTLDELVLWSSSDAMVQGWDASLLEDIETELAALDAAAPPR